MRPSCLACVLKHLASAIIYLRESRTGYPMHRVMAMAELEHASQESEEYFTELSSYILAERKNMQEDDEYQPGLWFSLEKAWDMYCLEEVLTNEEPGTQSKVGEPGDAGSDEAVHPEDVEGEVGG